MSIGTAGRETVSPSLPRELIGFSLGLWLLGCVIWELRNQKGTTSVEFYCPACICYTDTRASCHLFGILQVITLVCWTASFHCSAVTPFTQPLGHYSHGNVAEIIW